MKPWLMWILVVVVALGAAGGGYWFGHRGAGAAPADAEADAGENAPKVKSVATVSVAPIVRGSISEKITAYGTVIAPASEVRAVSVPFESRVTRMLVTPGQVVPAGAPLIEVEGSAATALAFEEANNTLSAANRDMQLVQQRFDQKLATNQELYTAQNAVRAARARLQSLQQGGAGGPRQLKAAVAGIVNKVDVQLGQVVPAGNPLVEVAAQDRVEVKLGVEAEDVPYLKISEPIRLFPVNAAATRPVDGRVRLIGQRVDPSTRLVDVLVSLPKGANLMLDGFVAGEVTRTAADGLIVPREAVLPEGNGYTLYTIKDGHAVKHAVQVGLENDANVQITGEGLVEGEPAVVMGNFELADGMDVQVQSAAAQPAPAVAPQNATQPASSQPAASQPAATEAAK
ncbi:MAG TPA: efflux RND transporter periplasmic adaptor subunit [Tepidisphaeraceae bacterium]|nr:efflux RND transporter periplasmic adaptor subunit [Tepidisphaeraceae bacterium]